jgi:hypothetical protein
MMEPTKPSRRVLRHVRNLIAQVQEDIGADAVVVIFTQTKRNASHCSFVTYGNEFACRQMVEEMADSYDGDGFPSLEDEDEESLPGDSDADA